MPQSYLSWKDKQAERITRSKLNEMDASSSDLCWHECGQAYTKNDIFFLQLSPLKRIKVCECQTIREYSRGRIFGCILSTETWLLGYLNLPGVE